MLALPCPEVAVVTALEADVAAAVAGDRRALEAVVTECLPRVRNLARYLVRGDADADDVAQEVMVAIVRKLPTWRGDGALQSWVDRIAVREAFLALRRSRRARDRVDAGADLTVVPDPGGAPDAYAERRRAVAALDQLSDDQRHAVVLHHVLGMSVPEAAAEIGAPLETVRSRLRQGIARLRAIHREDAP
ncbi:MAG: RNA polymerase sigma factor [Kofleriaceae bacterium]|nr:RNA polymerase sigma factor [Kofleriaceae bacterium]